MSKCSEVYLQHKALGTKLTFLEKRCYLPASLKIGVKPFSETWKSQTKSPQFLLNFLKVIDNLQL